MPAAPGNNAYFAFNGFLIAAQGFAKRDQFRFILGLNDPVLGKHFRKHIIVTGE